MSKRRMCIPTLDPRGGGGVLSLTEFIYDAAEFAGFKPHIAYNAIQWEKCVTISDMLRGRWRVPREQNSVNEFNGELIGRVLPEVEVLDYLGNYRHWSGVMNGADVIFGVGGNCLPLLPAAYSGRPFGCWVATLIEEEREVQAEGIGLPRRIRDIATRPILKQYEKYVLQRARVIVALSEYTKEQIITQHSIPRDDVRVLPFPINTDRYRPGNFSQRNGAELLFVGRINDPRKNVSLLLRAFSDVLNTFPEAQLTLVGDNPNDTLVNQAAHLGISDNVSFLGKVPSVVPYLQRASVFVLPSSQEGLGIAGLEAMSCGLPVVVTQCGGPEDYVIDGYNGYLVPKENPNAIAKRVCTLLSDTELRAELGRTAREHIQTHYSRAELRTEFVDVLNELGESRQDG